jgi:hypothetical protein
VDMLFPLCGEEEQGTLESTLIINIILRFNLTRNVWHISCHKYFIKEGISVK